MQVMDEGLKSDFGFEHLAWFYSGRRGVHCWVCDEGARKLSNEARSSVATYFEVSALDRWFDCVIIFATHCTMPVYFAIAHLNLAIIPPGQLGIRKEQELSPLQSSPPHAITCLQYS